MGSESWSSQVKRERGNTFFTTGGFLKSCCSLGMTEEGLWVFSGGAVIQQTDWAGFSLPQHGMAALCLMAQQEGQSIEEASAVK